MKSIDRDIPWLARKSLPLVLQDEATECGLACLAMVARYHGIRTDLRSLRCRFPISMRGANLSKLAGIAQRIGFDARGLRLDPRHLRHLKLPVILHWDLSHFVVLKQVRSRSYVIHDPAIGARRISADEFGRRFTGIALELSPSADFSKLRIGRPMGVGALLGRFTGLKSALMKILVISLGIQAFALVFPWQLQLIIDKAIVTRDSDFLLAVSLGFLAIVVLHVLTEAMRSSLVLFLGSQFNAHTATGLFRHMLHLPLEYFERRSIGDVISRFGSLHAIREFVSKDSVQAAVDGVMAITTLAAMIAYSTSLAAISAAAVTLYLLVRLIAYRMQRQRNESRIVAQSKHDSAFIETLRGIQTVKACGKEFERHDVWKNALHNLIEASFKVGALMIGHQATNKLIYGVENTTIIFFAAQDIIAGHLSAGMLLAFLAYKQQFAERSAALIEMAINLKMLGLHTSRISDIALSEQEPYLFSNNEVVTECAGDLFLKDIGFRYSEDEPMLFERLDLRIQAGECVAIVGPSGAGKSTLVKLMMGLIAPTKGVVNTSGSDIRALSLSWYRSQVAAVLQDDQLLSGSISQNICFFESAPDFERIRLCARQARIDEHIRSMPMAYDSQIGDMGSSLSGGQKQRLLLARALYRQPKILFLDEATSHLDIDTERHVTRTVAALSITRVVIAHRIETVRNCDRVLLLSNGCLEDVTHEYASGQPAAFAGVTC